MPKLSPVGFDSVANRYLFVQDVGSLDQLNADLDLGSRYFVCLVAADTTQVPAAERLALARRLCAAGCVYLLAWGPGCEALHDAADEVLAREFEDGGKVHRITTWHAGEPLSEALWSALWAAWPADAFFDECNALLVLCVGAPHWADPCRKALQDVRRFSQSVLGYPEDRQWPAPLADAQEATAESRSAFGAHVGLVPLEEDVLHLLLAGDDAVLVVLRQQLAQASVWFRSCSGVGIFCDFDVPASAPRVEHPRDFVFGDVHADVPGLELGLDFVLLVRDGALAMLEGFAFDEPWPESLEGLSLRYHDAGGRRGLPWRGA